MKESNRNPKQISPFPTFARAPRSALNRVGRSFHAAKASHLAIEMVPRSWAGVHRDHCEEKKTKKKKTTFCTFWTPSKKTTGTSRGAGGGVVLTGTAHAAVEGVGRAAGLGEVVVDVADGRGQSVAAGARA